ncbi:MAG: hypothetical protein IJC75_05245, partial [Oscillospiraceae bacterium]|nr:hypothetical protein [Oscillospiraceae bacterium]
MNANADQTRNRLQDRQHNCCRAGKTPYRFLPIAAPPFQADAIHSKGYAANAQTRQIGKPKGMTRYGRGVHFQYFLHKRIPHYAHLNIFARHEKARVLHRLGKKSRNGQYGISIGQPHGYSQADQAPLRPQSKIPDQFQQDN